MKPDNLLKPDRTRRDFLRNAGVSIALPFLASSTASQCFGSSLKETSLHSGPKRMVFVSTGLGMNPRSFFPKDFGEDFTPSPVLKSMAKHAGDFTVFSHMDHPHIYNKHGGINSLLNGVLNKNARPGQNISIDQVAAEHLGYTTRFPSVHISLGGGIGHSYSSSGVKLRAEGSPDDLFKKLFVRDSEAAKKKLAKEIEEQGSVLDLIRVQAKRLEKSINPVDRAKLDEYLTAIRDAEKRLQGMKRWRKIAKPRITTAQYDPTARSHGRMDYGFLGPIMFDLLALTLQSDSSRVITANFSMHNRVIELDGVTRGYHSLSHHGRRPELQKELQIIESFYIDQLSRFISKLSDSKVGGKSMLNDTMVFFGSGISDASRHSNRDLPIILAGGGFKHKGHYNATQKHNQRQTPLNNLFTSMLQNFGIETESFNGATGDMNHVLS